MSSRDYLGERAAILGLPAPSSTSAGGSCQLLEAADGWWALSLARADDTELVPALTFGDDLIRWSLAQRTADIIERTTMLGLPAAAIPAQTSSVVVPPAPPTGDLTGVRVLDLSSLWAGPLAAHLLQQLGASVTKLESLERPDGARRGNPEFFRLLNDGKHSMSAPLAEFAALINEADVVIESSRPRALRQLGIRAEEFTGTWVSITAYGRASDRVGFGDDVAAGAGLVSWVDGRPHFVGDAVADPLTGIAAAHAALRGPGLHDVSMHEVCRRQVLDAAA